MWCSELTLIMIMLLRFLDCRLELKCCNVILCCDGLWRSTVMGTDRVVSISINYIWLLSPPGPCDISPSELYFSFTIPSPGHAPLTTAVAAHYNCTPNNPSLAQVSSYHYQHNYNNTWPGCQQSPVFSPLRPGNTSWWEPPASVTAPQNIDSYQIWTFKRFEMLFDLMIILVSDLTNKNGLTLDTWTDNSSNSLISPTSIHYQF